MSDESEHVIEQDEALTMSMFVNKGDLNAARRRRVTDAMCEVAIETYAQNRIQGFSYQDRHVIRDVFLPPEDQEIWGCGIAGLAEQAAFQRQVRIERMRKALEAALALSSHQGNCK